MPGSEKYKRSNFSEPPQPTNGNENENLTVIIVAVCVIAILLAGIGCGFIVHRKRNAPLFKEIPTVR